MPLIIALLRRLVPVLFARLAAFVAGWFSKLAPGATTAVVKLTSNLGKIAMVVAAIGVAVAVFSAAISLALDGLSKFAPDDLLVVGRMLFPSNLETCIAVLVLARLKSLVFFWVVRLSEKFERS